MRYYESSFVNVLHHLLEFSERNLAISIVINLTHDLLDLVRCNTLSKAKHLLNLFFGYRATVVLVKHLEGSLQLLLSKQILRIDGSYDEF